MIIVFLDCGSFGFSFQDISGCKLLAVWWNGLASSQEGSTADMEICDLGWSANQLLTSLCLTT